MAVREYIGARYVPIFVGQWDNTKTYEPLSVVQYQGNSFTSRQYVPIGIEITNEDFWIETGNYNAQIEAYRQEVLTFDGRITANEQNIASQGSSIAALVAKTNYFCPEQFGAVGDGVTDDTAAFEDMLEAMEYGDTAVLQGDKTYVLTSSLLIEKRHISFTSFGMSENIPGMVWDLGANPANYANFHCIELVVDGCNFSNILFGTRMDIKNYPSSSANGNFIFAINTQNLETDFRYDIDSVFYECCFWNAWNVFSIEGRNIWIHHCLFSTIAANCFKIHNLTVPDPDGLRGYRITDNRFHVAGWIVDTVDITTYPETFNLVFKGNFIDFSKCIYTGISDNVDISNNTIYQTALENDYLIRLHKTISDGASANIVGNFCNTLGSPTSGAQGNMKGLINVGVNVRGFLNIASNTFITFNETSPIVQILKTTKNILVNIVGNVFHNEASVTPVQLNPDANNKIYGIITGNSISANNAENFITAGNKVTVDNNYTANFAITENDDNE